MDHTALGLLMTSVVVGLALLNKEGQADTENERDSIASTAREPRVAGGDRSPAVLRSTVPQNQ
jgi:hypothetical protein